MTVEHRFVVGLKDIRSVTLECKKCGARLSIAPTPFGVAVVQNCPSCNELWLSASVTHGQYFVSPLTSFLQTLAKSLEQDDERINVRILLEFDEPTSGASSASAL